MEAAIQHGQGARPSVILLLQKQAAYHRHQRCLSYWSLQVLQQSGLAKTSHRVNTIKATTTPHHRHHHHHHHHHSPTQRAPPSPSSPSSPSPSPIISHFNPAHSSNHHQLRSSSWISSKGAQLLASSHSFRLFSSLSPAMAEHTLSGTVTEPRFQDPKEVNNLIHQMEQGLKKGQVGYNCKRTTFRLAGQKMDVHSWKFQDWDYKKRDLPTYARGLFTYRNPNGGNHEILIRGYDKFFNIDEVHQTSWNWIRENTKGPYELTVKENGCIIFLSGLSDDTLLVCSKHSTGARQDVELSHAIAGERWIDKHLASVGKTRAELARHLRQMNATAVGELCDDSFEEHILAYTEDQAGLYIHGINFNTPTFATCSQGEVQKFAETYGMVKTDYFEMKNVESLKLFLEEAAETGSWDGKDVEGFVIRCKARNGPNDSEWHDWFFKYKFEEPYLMYRQWREVTKSMLSGKQPRFKKHVTVTKEYLNFAKGYFQQNPNLIKEYQANHGIIKLRDAFLENRGAKGSDLVKLEGESEVPKTKDGKETGHKIVIVPVASIGCGKTTLAIALSRLFKWGHVQNDNLLGPKRSVRFAQAVVRGLNTHQAVIADRNNHQRRERQQIFEDIGGAAPGTQFVALHYVHYRPDINDHQYKERIRKVTRERVFNRGDNHQTIQAATLPSNSVISIMEGFVKRFEPVDQEERPDWLFHTVIDLDIEADSRTNLETAVLHLKEAFPDILPEMPTSEQMDEAIKFALNEYRGKNISPPKEEPERTPKVLVQLPKQEKSKPIEYFAVQVPYDAVYNTISSTFDSLPPEQSAFFSQLKSTSRVQSAFHVTLIHRASLKNNGRQIQKNQTIWDNYVKLTSAHTDEPLPVTVKLNQVVWDGRLMAVAVQLESAEGLGKAKHLTCVNDVPHITIGTRGAAIKPKESNNMLVMWKDAGRNAEDIKAVDLGGVEIEGKLAVVYVAH